MPAFDNSDIVNVTDLADRVTALEVGGGVGGGGAAVAIDLTAAPYNVVANDSTKGTQNSTGVQLAIDTFNGLKADLKLPRGDVYLNQAGTSNWFVKFGPGATGLTLSGHGKETRIIGQADGDAGESAVIELDQVNGITLRDFFIEHGTINKPDPSQLNFLIRVNNSHAGGGGDAGKTRNVRIENVDFGKTWGDGLAMRAGSASDNIVENIHCRNLHMSLAGHCMRNWEPSTTYAAYEQINNTVITCATKANLVDADYLTIGDVANRVLVRKVYEFDTAGNGVTAGRIQVNVSTDTTAAEVAARLRTAILANQPGLSVTDVGGGVLRLGNVATMTENVAHASFTISAESYQCYTAGTSASSGAGPSGGVYPPVGAGDRVTDGTVVWNKHNGIRYGARAGVTFQKGYDTVTFKDCYLENSQNSPWDTESTGVGVRRRIDVDGFVVRNNGNTGIAMSFGSTLDGVAEDCTYRNVDTAGGRWHITYTKNLVIENSRCVVDAILPDGDDQPMIEIRGTNENLRIVNPAFISKAGAAAPLVDNEKGDVTVEGGYLEQGRAASIARMDGGRLRMFGTKCRWTASSGASTVNMFQANATLDHVDDFQLSGVQLKINTGNAASFAYVGSRGTKANRHVSIAGCRVEGGLANACYFSKQAGSAMDANPVLQRNNFNAAPLYYQVDENDNQVTKSVFPIIEGNREGGYTITGTIDPTGNARAPQGAKYIWVNGNSTKFYLKREGSGFGGWSEVTSGPPSFSAYQLPDTSAEFTTLIADNTLTTVAPTLSYACQEASGNLAAAIGSIALTAAGSVTYANAETGYTDTSIGVPDNAASTGFSTTDALLANPATTSRLMIMIARLTAVPAAGRGFMQISDTDQIRVQNTGGNARARVFLSGNDSTPANDLSTTQFKIYFAQVNETLNTCIFGNEDFKHTHGYTAPSSTTKRIGIGGFDATSAPMRALRVWYWEGENAEWTQAQIKEFLIALGAGVAWTAA